MSFLTSEEDIPSAMKALGMSLHKTGKSVLWDEESNVDDSMVSEDLPQSPESSDPNITISDSLSQENDDSEEASSLGAIKTQNEVPRGNAELNLVAKTYRNKK